MHLPNNLIHGATCPVTAAIALGGVATALYLSSKSKTNITPHRFASFVCLILALQMMNFPVLSGVSGHFIGITLAIALMGAPLAILAMTIIISIQCFAFGDGGLNALGANILNMALVGAIPAILFGNKLGQNKMNILFSSLLSIVLSATACTIEIWLSSPALSLASVAWSMISIHAVIGIAEAAITLSLLSLFIAPRVEKPIWWTNKAPFATAFVIAIFLAPFASTLPDGLEWVTKKYQLLSLSTSNHITSLSPYQQLELNPFINTTIAACLAIGVIYVFAYLTNSIINTSIAKNTSVFPIFNNLLKK